MKLTELKNYELYKYLFTDKESSIYTFGLECGPGWATLINDTCLKIGYVDRYREATIFQIKEKFGYMCFYVNNTSNKILNDIIFDITTNVELKSKYICHSCGNDKKYIFDLAKYKCKNCEK